MSVPSTSPTVTKFGHAVSISPTSKQIHEQIYRNSVHVLRFDVPLLSLFVCFPCIAGDAVLGSQYVSAFHIWHGCQVPTDTGYRFLWPTNTYINPHTGIAFMFFVSMSHYGGCSFAAHVLQGMLSCVVRIMYIEHGVHRADRPVHCTRHCEGNCLPSRGSPPGRAHGSTGVPAESRLCGPKPKPGASRNAA